MRALLIASLLTGAAFANAAAAEQQQLKAITENLSEITSLIEQLTPGQAAAKWDDPRIPGNAADRKQALTDAGCQYTFPEDPAQDAIGIPVGKIEVGGPNCPISIDMNVSGTMAERGMDVTVDILYKLKNRAAFPDDDVTDIHFVMKFTGNVELNEATGVINLDVTGVFTNTGTSIKHGPFKDNSTAKIVLKLNGFNLEMLQSRDTEFTYGGKSGKFKDEVKGGFFGAEEHYWIDGQEVEKEKYLTTFGEYKAPYFSASALNKPKFISACRVEMFPGTTDLTALTAYAETGAALRVTPLKQLNACATDMERETQWDGQTLKSRFQFGREYLMVKPQFSAATGQVATKPFYALYDERQSRIDKAGDNYMVFICEPVKTCP